MNPMLKFLLQLHRQVEEALRIGKDFAAARKKPAFDKILFCGMGGSAISGDIIRCLALSSGRYPFTVMRSAEIPKWVDRKTLVIISSYSGNTREALTFFSKARPRCPHFLIVTSGGHLAVQAKRMRLPTMTVPAGFPPRCAVGYLTFSLLPVLKKWGILFYSDADIRETQNLMKKYPRKQADVIAGKLAGRAVHFYGLSGSMEPVLLRWRAQLAENSKMLASHHVIPETFHNEIEGWHGPASLIHKSTAVFFADRDEPAWILRKRKVAGRLISKRGGRVMEIKSCGRSPLARIFSLIVLADWVSFELAQRCRVNPLAIPNIDTIKKID